MSDKTQLLADYMTPELAHQLKIMQESAAAAIAENHARGIPDFFMRDGVMIYRYADGRETTECPEVLKPKTPMSPEREAELRAKGVIR